MVRCVFLFCILVGTITYSASGQPKMLAYSGIPTDYINEHAPDIARSYDGLIFVAGDWDEGVAKNIGFGTPDSPIGDWFRRVSENVRHLCEAGATESILDVHFSENGVWPSPNTLLSSEFTVKMAKHFSRLGQVAKESGFRGVAIDVEYPYKRYSLDHEIYTWDGYTAEDLLRAAENQGRATMAALLDAYPEAVVLLLPGAFQSRPIGRYYMKGLLDVMAERDAPGGLHLAYERSYCLYEGPVSQIALCRDGDLSVENLWKGNETVLRYWKKRCSVAPGAWPLHMVETGGPDYPKRPWKEELADLRAQLETLRTVVKQYVWSYSGAPIWCPADPDVRTKYGIAPASFEGAADVVREWLEITTDKTAKTDPRAERLVHAVHAYDRGDLPAGDLCCVFGTPPAWYVAAPLGNPFTKPQFAAARTFTAPIRLDLPLQGRDSVVRWFLFPNLAPIGSVSMTAIFDWRNTDDQSAFLVTQVVSDRTQKAWIHVGWDDGLQVWLGNDCVLDRASYPPRGHGALYKDRFLFEDHAEVTLPAGTTRLGVVSINAGGSWVFNLRITDADGFPLEGVRFQLPDPDAEI